MQNQLWTLKVSYQIKILSDLYQSTLRFILNNFNWQLEFSSQPFCSTTQSLFITHEMCQIKRN
jgi:hypothetical protein